MWEPLLFPYFSMVIFLRVPRCYWDLRFGLEDRDNARFWFYWWLRVPRLVSMSLRTYFHHRKFCGLTLLLPPALVLLLVGWFQYCCFRISGMKYETILLHHSAGIDLIFLCGEGGSCCYSKKLLKSAQQQSKIIRATQPNGDLCSTLRNNRNRYHDHPKAILNRIWFEKIQTNNNVRYSPVLVAYAPIH